MALPSEDLDKYYEQCGRLVRLNLRRYPTLIDYHRYIRAEALALLLQESTEIDAMPSDEVMWYVCRYAVDDIAERYRDVYGGEYGTE